MVKKKRRWHCSCGKSFVTFRSFVFHYMQGRPILCIPIAEHMPLAAELAAWANRHHLIAPNPVASKFVFISAQIEEEKHGVV